ncbi:YjbF family lipoprotein [Aquicoccus sp.]|uniref:YjbF family lipoprotein n=1 Tax=Aquicoccus sp. TaxID=2055851 RepID=UPI003563B89D
MRFPSFSVPRPRRVSPVLTITITACAMMLALGGCDRITPALGLTGKVEPVPLQPIATERLRVVLPKTGAEASLAPVSRRGDVTVWQTLDGITLSFRRGSLIATRGLGDDLMSADVDGRLEMLRNSRDPGEHGYYPHIRSYLDGEDRTVFRSYQCRRVAQTQAGTEAEAGITSGQLRRIEELCVSPVDRFTNVYWLDPGGTVIRSRQWISPMLEYMETTRVPR